MLKINICMVLSGLALFISACTRTKKEKTIYLLTAGKAKDWTEVKPYPIKRYSGLRFEANGRCDKYSTINGARTRADGTGTKVKISSLAYSPEWKIVNDSTLYIGWLGNVKVEYIDENVMILNQMRQKRVIVYLKAKDQISKFLEDTSGPSISM